MPRVARGFKARRRRKRILKQASGYVGGRSRQIRSASEAVDRALVYAYRDRRQKKRDFRSLWIVRIGAAAHENGTTYSRLMGGLKKAGVDLDRKVLANLAIMDPAGFAAVVQSSQSN